MQWGPYPLVHEGDAICTISDRLRTEERVVTAPVTGLVVGSLENPVALPGRPLRHLLEIDAETREEIEREIETGEFDGYRALNRNFRPHDWISKGFDRADGNAATTGRPGRRPERDQSARSSFSSRRESR